MVKLCQDCIAKVNVYRFVVNVQYHWFKKVNMLFTETKMLVLRKACASFEHLHEAMKHQDAFVLCTSAAWDTKEEEENLDFLG